MLCPQPRKAGYRTQETAEKALHNPRLGQTLYSPTRAYECPCGKWHLTAQRKKFNSNAGRSKRNRR